MFAIIDMNLHKIIYIYQKHRKNEKVIDFTGAFPSDSWGAR